MGICSASIQIGSRDQVALAFELHMPRIGTADIYVGLLALRVHLRSGEASIYKSRTVNASHPHRSSPFRPLFHFFVPSSSP